MIPRWKQEMLRKARKGDTFRPHVASTARRFVQTEIDDLRRKLENTGPGTDEHADLQADLDYFTQQGIRKRSRKSLTKN